MSDVLPEIKTSPKNDQQSLPLHDDLFKEMRSNAKNELAVTRASDKATDPLQGLMPKNLEKDLKDLQGALEKTQKEIAELHKKYNSGLYDLEMNRRTMLHNPYKILTAGSGLAMLSKSHALATVPLAGFAGMQAYDDIKSLGEQNTFAGRGKYTLGVAADTAIGAGALGFLSDSVPMKYKAPLLVGGLLARAAIDFIPNHNKK